MTQVDIAELQVTARLRIEAAHQSLDFDGRLGKLSKELGEGGTVFGLTLDQLDEAVQTVAAAQKLSPMVVLALALSELTKLEHYSGL